MMCDLKEVPIQLEKRVGSVYICTVCNKELPDEVAFKDHFDVHVSGRHYECPFCDTNVARQVSLARHLKLAHKNKAKRANQPDTNDSMQQDHNYHEKPVCNNCKKQLQNAYELEKHECIILKETELKHRHNTFKEVNAMPSNSAKSTELLATHRKIIKTNKPEKKTKEPRVTECSICKKNFPTENAYMKHFSEFASKSKPFFCCMCETSFSRKRSLVFHLYIHKRSSDPDKVSRMSDIIVPPRPVFIDVKPTKNDKEKGTFKVISGTAKKEKVPETKLLAKKKASPKRKSTSHSTAKASTKDMPRIIDLSSTAQSHQKCTICHSGYKSVAELETHMLHWHQAPLIHQCSLCSLAFVLKASLLSHAVSHIF